TNYNQAPGYISFGQTNFGEADAGSTNCDLVFNSTVKGCPGETVTLTSEFINVQDGFQWFKYNEQTDEWDLIPGEYEGTYETTESGDYKLNSFDSNFVQEVEIFTVEFQPEPDVTVPTDMSLCNGELLTLDAGLGNAAEYSDINYQWLLDGNDIADGTSSTLD
ncbi:MAG: hypothetical protein ACTIKA_10605, partial [Psychroflexus halocasei]